MTTYIFHDLDPIQKRLVQLADDLGYVVLAEVTGRSQTDKLARVNLNETDLTPAKINTNKGPAINFGA